MPGLSGHYIYKIKYEEKNLDNNRNQYQLLRDRPRCHTIFGDASVVIENSSDPGDVVGHPRVDPGIVGGTTTTIAHHAEESETSVSRHEQGATWKIGY